MESIAERIRTLRKKSGLNQEEMSKVLKLPSGQTDVSRLEKGKKPIYVDDILRLVEELRANPIWLLYGQGEMLLEKGVLQYETPDGLVINPKDRDGYVRSLEQQIQLYEDYKQMSDENIARMKDELQKLTASIK